MWEWDPLEFSGAPEGECDCVVDDLLSRLVAGGSRDELVGVLEGEAERFGVPLGSLAERAGLADRVPAWWARVPAQPAAE